MCSVRLGRIPTPDMKIENPCKQMNYVLCQSTFFILYFGLDIILQGVHELVVAAMLDHSLSVPRKTPQREGANQCHNHQRPGWRACSRLHLAIDEKNRHSAQRPPMPQSRQRI